jgi:hypothetical protein
MSREDDFGDSESFLPKQMTVELRSLLVKARLINENSQEEFDYSFTSIFLAFLIANDPNSRSFQQYVKQTDIRIFEIIKSKGLPQTVLLRGSHESISTPERRPTITRSVQAIFRFALSLMMAIRGQREQSLDTRHVMGAYIYAPYTHEEELKSWGIDLEKWSEVFLSQIAFLFPSELFYWIQAHDRKFRTRLSFDVEEIIENLNSFKKVRVGQLLEFEDISELGHIVKVSDNVYVLKGCR